MDSFSKFIILLLQLNNNEIDTKEIEALFHQGMKLQSIEEHLIRNGFQGEVLDGLIRYVKELKFRKQRNIGFKCLTLGAILCLSSCLLTFFQSYSDVSTLFILYGLTSIGSCFLLLGLALVLGL